MRRVIFETHATSLDNEAGLASGQFDVDLAPLGERQAVELGIRYGLALPSVVLTSDLQRAWRTASIAFNDRVRIVRDSRLRECDYGRLTRRPVAEIEALRLSAVETPFPNGESYSDVVRRVHEFLEEVGHAWPGGHVLVIGHRATLYAIAHLLTGVPLRTLVAKPFRWQPGWQFALPNRVE